MISKGAILFIMRNKIIVRNLLIIIAIFTLFLLLGFCTSGPAIGGTAITEDGREVYEYLTPYDYYFQDLDKEIWNNIWFYTDKYYLADVVSAITDIIEDEEKITVKFQFFTGVPLGNSVTLDKKAVSIRQNDDLFMATGGEGLIDFEGMTYTPYKGFPPLRVEKDKFKEILDKLNSEDQKYLTTYYETGLPEEVEWFRFESLFQNQLIKEDRKEDEELLNQSYTRNGNWYKLNNDVTKQNKDKLLDIISSVENRYCYIEGINFDYKNYYISKFDLPQGNRDILFYQWEGYSRSQIRTLQDIFYSIGYDMGLQFEIYFSKTGKKTGQEFDINYPFDLVYNCPYCFNFNDVWVNPPAEESE
jgi:hypothetical protein